MSTAILGGQFFHDDKYDFKSHSLLLTADLLYNKNII